MIKRNGGSDVIESGDGAITWGGEGTCVPYNIGTNYLGGYVGNGYDVCTCRNWQSGEIIIQEELNLCMS